jgi:hypothetical protein
MAWRVTWHTRRGAVQSEACETYEAALTLKDDLEGKGMAFVCVEEVSEDEDQND